MIINFSPKNLFWFVLIFFLVLFELGSCTNRITRKANEKCCEEQGEERVKKGSSKETETTKKRERKRETLCASDACVYMRAFELVVEIMKPSETKEKRRHVLEIERKTKSISITATTTAITSKKNR